MATIAEPAVAGPSKPRTQLCGVCSASTSKYTCPRCSFATCSLGCSKTHKERFACSGIRDPTAFRPLKDFTQGAWGDDFRWLEEGRRKIAAWGEGLPKEETGGYGSGHGQGSGGGGGGRGRGRGGRGGRGAGGGGGMAGGRTRKSAHELLRAQMARKGAWMEVMPEGMGRRKINQSGFNAKTQTIHLTVQFCVPAGLCSHFETDKVAIPLETQSRTITHPRVLFAHPDEILLPKLSSFFAPTLPEDTVIALPFHPSPARPVPHDLPAPPPRLYFPPLDPSKPLSSLLRGTAFAEFPTFHLIPRGSWDDALSRGQTRIVPLAEPRVGGGHGGDAGVGRHQDSGWGNKRKAGAEGGQGIEIQDAAKKIRADEGLLVLGEYESDVSDEDVAEEAHTAGEAENAYDEDEVDSKDAEGEGETGQEGDVVVHLGEQEAAVLEAVGQAMEADLERM